MSVRLQDLTVNPNPDDLALRQRLSGLGRDFNQTPWLTDINIEPSTTGGELVEGFEMLAQQIRNVIGILLGQEYGEPGLGSTVWLEIFSPANLKNANNLDTLLFRLETGLIEALNNCLGDKIVVNHSLTTIESSADQESYVVTVVCWSLEYQNNQTHTFLVRKP